MVHVTYDDGDEKWERLNQGITLLRVFKVREEVEALWTDVDGQAFYPARIDKVHKGGKFYTIKWNDGDSRNRAQPAENVRAPTSTTTTTITATTTTTTTTTTAAATATVIQQEVPAVLPIATGPNGTSTGSGMTTSSSGGSSTTTLWPPSGMRGGDVPAASTRGQHKEQVWLQPGRSLTTRQMCAD